MDQKNEIREITRDVFFATVIRMKMELWRLVQICAVRVEGGYDMSYSFCRNYEMVTLRLRLRYSVLAVRLVLTNPSFSATASGIGQLIVKKATVSGAEGGCQAECGSAAAMAAGAVVEMLGGTPAQAFDAAAIAMQNIMGLVCDPVAGLVEMPCAKRNASGVANALVSADLALSGIFSEIPFDEVVEAMYKVGKALPSTLRETALGGVATTPTALAMKEKIYGKGAAESACSGDCASCGLC